MLARIPRHLMRIALVVGPCLLILLISNRSFAATDNYAEEMMRRSFSAPLTDDSFGTAVMTLTLGNGQVRERRMTSWTKTRPGSTQNMRLTRFESPADVRGTATLLIEDEADDDVWVYLPALKRSRRVIADQKKDSFMGSDLSYGDVVGYKVSDWTHQIKGESEQAGRPCTLLESTPTTDKARKTSGYSKRESCIDKASLLATRIKAWDLNGRDLKEIIYSELREVDPVKSKWHAMRIEARNVQTKTRTLIQIHDEQVNVGLTDDVFTPTALEREE